jgi:hypothetical protein
MAGGSDCPAAHRRSLSVPAGALPSASRPGLASVESFQIVTAFAAKQEQPAA